jgi:hypothetical protein
MRIFSAVAASSSIEAASSRPILAIAAAFSQALLHGIIERKQVAAARTDGIFRIVASA